MKKLKKKYEFTTLTNSEISFNTVDVTNDTINFYIQKGFAFIFEDVKESKKK